ncbi:hypothetical protein JMJ77_0005789 [Colletotrichum scovillei]|uniref:Uncharacterized protein n=1 Tax=Colletotrichum scovillei TaxID=1209932 RepID=A0A9P7RH43_9PEZI|nr:hypothetical protein JMJ77_0005789 [Colletotrichum scovillei]KAG7077048.1 hypothetical protein JMJ76_0014302 [Colletotrichum scovillei]KAG7084188.1 hypothetical protein JMJ78_0009627 [Colletotrichum scovillei]
MTPPARCHQGPHVINNLKVGSDQYPPGSAARPSQRMPPAPRLVCISFHKVIPGDPGPIISQLHPPGPSNSHLSATKAAFRPPT